MGVIIGNNRHYELSKVKANNHTMGYPPAARRPWYTGWWYIWLAVAIGMAAVWLVFFTGLFVRESTETAEVGNEDGIVAENTTNGTALLNETSSLDISKNPYQKI